VKNYQATLRHQLIAKTQLNISRLFHQLNSFLSAKSTSTSVSHWSSAMDLTQQVKNYQATLRHSQRQQPTFKEQDKTETDHGKALQALANGIDVKYQSTLRVVQHEGSRGPHLPPKQTQKHPGFIRNELGGTFTA